MKKAVLLISTKTKAKCIGVIILAICGAILASIWPVRLGNLYTSISNGTIHSLEQGYVAIITFGIIYLLAESITVVRRVMLDCIIATHESEVRERSIEKLLKMPVSYYSGCLSGEKTAQLNQGVAGFSQLIKIICNDVFSTVLTAVCTLIQVFLNAPAVMVAIMTTYLLVTVTISVFQIKSQNGIRESIVGQKNALDGKVCQSIANLELIRGLHAETYEIRRLLPSILSISRTEKRHHRYMGSFDCIKQFCKICFQVILLAASIWLVTAGKMTSGCVISVCLLFQQLVKPIDEVYRFMDETASSMIKAKTLCEVMFKSSDRIFDISSTKGVMYENDIRLSDVVVTNPEGDSPLAWYENITIPGEKIIALQGPNGCGKTSLIRCLNRYYPHAKGQITLFGRDLESYDQKELAEQVYYSPQRSFFFDGTVRENLMYGIDHMVSDDELIDALEKVHLVGEDHKDTVIKKNAKEALECHISEKAEELSGGMKQRLSLARAFLRTPKMFIFDEITANLDKEATDYVLGNIEEYASSIGAGIIYISHDPMVVDRCDETIVIQNKLRNDQQKNTAKSRQIIKIPKSDVNKAIV